MVRCLSAAEKQQGATGDTAIPRELGAVTKNRSLPTFAAGRKRLALVLGSKTGSCLAKGVGIERVEPHTVDNLGAPIGSTLQRTDPVLLIDAEGCH